MRRVAVVGLGTTQFRARWTEKTYFELGFEAAKSALADAGLSRADVDCCVYGMSNDFFSRQSQPDMILHDYIGLPPKPSVRVNSGGATGGSALRIGFAEIASGMYDSCLVLGVEKCADCFDYEAGRSSPEMLRAALYAADMTYDNPAGRTAVSGYALAVAAHQEKFGGPAEEQMAKVSIKNHGNAIRNPNAQSPKEITIEDVMNSPKICGPFKLFDNCVISEGASAVILMSEEKAKEVAKNPVWITGVGAAHDWPSAGSRENLYEFAGSRIAARRALDMAGVNDARRDLDLAELNDAFTATEIMAYEDCFLCGEGEGGRMIDEGATLADGDMPVNLSGGLIGCGHAAGATGIMQTIEVCLHLRGEACERQRANARRGLVQSCGGPQNAWTVCLVLERGDA
ncbi:MAG: thiolase family protein [bacterium]